MEQNLTLSKTLSASIAILTNNLNIMRTDYNQLHQQLLFQHNTNSKLLKSINKIISCYIDLKHEYAESKEFQNEMEQLISQYGPINMPELKKRKLNPFIQKQSKINDENDPSLKNCNHLKKKNLEIETTSIISIKKDNNLKLNNMKLVLDSKMNELKYVKQENKNLKWDMINLKNQLKQSKSDNQNLKKELENNNIGKRNLEITTTSIISIGKETEKDNSLKNMKLVLDAKMNELNDIKQENKNLKWDVVNIKNKLRQSKLENENLKNELKNNDNTCYDTKTDDNVSNVTKKMGSINTPLIGGDNINNGNNYDTIKANNEPRGLALLKSLTQKKPIRKRRGSFTITPKEQTYQDAETIATELKQYKQIEDLKKEIIQNKTHFEKEKKVLLNKIQKLSSQHSASEHNGDIQEIIKTLSLQLADKDEQIKELNRSKEMLTKQLLVFTKTSNS